MHTHRTAKAANRTHSLVVAAALIALCGCSRKPAQGDTANTRTSNGAVDTTALRTTAMVEAEGPGVHVTRTDTKSVDKATEYKLTTDNFTRFVAAADSLQALRTRDSSARAFLATDLTDAGASTMDAGLKWLDSNAAVSNAINAAGISTRDYYVQSIAIASAERFIGNPNAAPPTPTAKDNAEFLRGHQAELAHLQALRSGRPAVVSTP